MHSARSLLDLFHRLADKWSEKIFRRAKSELARTTEQKMRGMDSKKRAQMRIEGILEEMETLPQLTNTESNSEEEC